MFIYVNGEFVREKEAVISPFDHGFLYGLGVFETIRVYKGHPFLIDDHLKRLNDALKDLNIEAHITRENALKIINQLLKLNDLQNAYVRINVSAGESILGLSVEPYENPTEIFFMKGLSIPEGQTKKGELLSIRRNSPEGLYRLKSHHYLNNILAKREIGANQYMEGIFLTDEGFVAEGIVSNLFWVKDGKVYTPSIETGILNGVTRQYILTCLDLLRIPAFEGLYKKEELLESQEVFITNSLQEIVPITSIGSTRFVGQAGVITQQLKSLYRKHRTHLFSRHQLVSR
ncbi:aminodeoxychorismate lyase [Bacillus sp. FJAT-47783]|uniref:aminodeoxychorismate lyase n=1 Tax=Bacillus sp. FJAT-47783 TaxID=2922712 RepID=UPI001FAC6B6A